MHNAVVVVQPGGLGPVPVPRHSIMSAAGTTVVQLTCDSDLGNSVRGLDRVNVGPRQWLLVDLTTVTTATPSACAALIAVLDHVSPDRFCVVAAARSPWVGEMLPRRARRMTFLSVGDALQMLVFAEEGFGAAWLGSASVRPIKLDVTQSWLARCPLAPHAVAAAARDRRSIFALGSAPVVDRHAAMEL
jgi:hypothetical protein